MKETHQELTAGEMATAITACGNRLPGCWGWAKKTRKWGSTSKWTAVGGRMTEEGRIIWVLVRYSANPKNKGGEREIYWSCPGRTTSLSSELLNGGMPGKKGVTVLGLQREDQRIRPAYQREGRSLETQRQGLEDGERVRDTHSNCL